MVSPKAIKEFQEIYKKKCGKELTHEEAAEASRNLVGLFEILYDSHIAELKLKEKLKESPKGFSIMDGKTYNCGICYAQIKNEQLWYDKWGKKCLACQDAVSKRIIPGKICYNDQYWYATRELESYFKLKTPTVKKLIRQGVLKTRTIPKSGFEVFFVKDNIDVLPPKEIVKDISAKVKGKENMITIIPWYEIKDPKQTLRGYKIWPYLTAFHQPSKKS